MKIQKYIKKFFRRLKKQLFVRQFKYYDLSSGIGKDGAGKGCIIKGKEYIEIGKTAI